MKIDRTALPRASARNGVAYVEKGRLARDNHGMKVVRETGATSLPLAQLSAIMLGPGTTVTQPAAELASESGVPLLWTGADGIRAYGSIQPLSSNSKLLMRQAKVWADDELRTEAARRMYGVRFPDEDVSDKRIEVLRSMEGSRVRQAYRDTAAEFDLTWSGRQTQWAGGDELNQAITTATQSLYGICTSAVLSLGCSTGLGIIHTGHAMAFVYDLADLFKVEVALPVACKAVAEGAGEPGSVRKRMASAIRQERLIPKSVESIYYALGLPTPSNEFWTEDDLRLWGEQTVVSAGVNYADIW